MTRGPEERRLVIYVEDNPANIRLMRDLVGSLESVDLVTVPTAELGVDLARARRPALVIVDTDVPGMSGSDTLRVLRADPETMAIPVIALAAAASARERQRGVAEGFRHYLAMPVRIDELVDALESLLG